MSLGENIRNIRKSKGLSIMKLRELTGLSKSTISDLENSKSSPTAETLQKIADALGVNIEELFKDDFNIVKETTSEYKTGEFKTAETAMKFILKQPAVMGFGGFDINKMTDEEIVEFANELLRQLKLISYKYKK